MVGDAGFWTPEARLQDYVKETGTVEDAEEKVKAFWLDLLLCAES